jgi:hypothetical protein
MPPGWLRAKTPGVANGPPVGRLFPRKGVTSEGGLEEKKNLGMRNGEWKKSKE